ncbi:MAG: FAD-dependent oxidoreductase [Clostridiales bacterium]|jgi:NAD(P)H-nitrite reductase large subunit|nr:FAD-dependent oxidoreductase [Clostridiales bacterium]
MRYVVIGNSAAGIGAIEGIRQADPDGRITVISSEPYHTYSRPLISYFLMGKTDGERMRYRPEGFYESNGCETMLGVKAVSVDPGRKTVTLEGGASVEYDKLFVGAGSVPFVPPIEGLETVTNRFTFMTYDDALALKAAITPASRVLIVGAGLIGLKCAEGVAGSVAGITVVDLAPGALSSILDAEGSAIVREHLESRGIEFRLSDSVAKVSGGVATLVSGAEIEFDILVLAVGVRPDTALIRDAGGKCGRGILVDSFMRSSLPDIYAAGDCTESLDVSSGTVKVMALLPNAYRQGEVAGINMAGGSAELTDAIPMNAIGFFGLRVATAGTYEGEAYTDRKNGYKKLFYKDDTLKGFIIIGGIEKCGIYTSLVRERVPLSRINFPLIRENPGLIAFSRSYRDAKLGGAAI